MRRRRRPQRHQCTTCGRYAPHTPNGKPLWPGPLCTRCATRQFAARTGCDPTQAERLLVEERRRAVRDDQARYHIQPTLWENPPAHQPTPLPVRERPAYRVAAAPTACSVIELLTVLTGNAATAHALLTHFGSPSALAQASTLELVRSVRGVSERLAVQLKAACELGRRVMADRPEATPLIQSPADAAALLLPKMSLLEQEHLVVLLLNTRNRLLGEPVQVYCGSLNTALIRTGEVFRVAIKVNAAAILVAHNHPSGDASPSPEDVAVTRALIEAGKLLDIELVDHLILGRSAWVSLKERGLGDFVPDDRGQNRGSQTIPHP